MGLGSGYLMEFPDRFPRTVERLGTCRFAFKTGQLPNARAQVEFRCELEPFRMVGSVTIVA